MTEKDEFFRIEHGTAGLVPANAVCSLLVREKDLPGAEHDGHDKVAAINQLREPPPKDDAATDEEQIAHLVQKASDEINLWLDDVRRLCATI
jgi:hypothetical protein